MTESGIVGREGDTVIPASASYSPERALQRFGTCTQDVLGPLHLAGLLLTGRRVYIVKGWEGIVLGILIFILS